MPAVTDVSESVVDAINADSLAGSFPRPITAFEGYSITLPMEEDGSLGILVQPVPCQRETATLDGGVGETSSVRIVFEVAPVSEAIAAKQYLKLMELICDEIEDRIGSSFIYLGAEHDGEQLYDQGRLRNDAVFHSEMIVRFSSLRYTA